MELFEVANISQFRVHLLMKHSYFLHNMYNHFAKSPENKMVSRWDSGDSQKELKLCKDVDIKFPSMQIAHLHLTKNVKSQ